MTDTTDRVATAEALIEKLLAKLPRWLARSIHYVRRPHARWIRIPVALLLIVGGFLAFLPVFGVWMIPLSLILLAEDIPFLRDWVDRLVIWVAARKPTWFK